jgi:hypothetical protein
MNMASIDANSVRTPHSKRMSEALIRRKTTSQADLVLMKDHAALPA